MTASQVRVHNGRAELWIDGVLEPAMAYITYFDERSRCEDFARAGYSIFSVSASFTGLPINPRSGFSPSAGEGIFDKKGQPDYSLFESNVRRILKACPHAKIFPRVYVSMPQWWVDENPDEVCTTVRGDHREALYSRKYRKDGGELLRELIAHAQSSDYADHIIGYQLAGGGTQEWFHFDSNGSLSGCTEACFRTYPGVDVSAKVPDHSRVKVAGLLDLEMQKYLEFTAFDIGNTIAYFAKIAKECVNHRQIIGAFYGYSQSMFNVFQGNIGASVLLNCPDVDFFCAPVSYVKQRAMGIDWGDLCAGESIRKHGKLYFVENDIRTCLSDYPGNCRPGMDPEGKYNSPLWLGPPTVEQSVWAIRKAFARQYTHANAMWWFDMWGGWFACPEMMAEMQSFRELVADFFDSDKSTTRSQVVVLCDEKLPFRLGGEDRCVAIQETVRDNMGATGIPSDALILEDYEDCVFYDGVLFAFPADFDTPEVTNIKDFLNRRNIPYAQVSSEDYAIDAAGLRKYLLDLGMHCYCDTGDVIYCGNGLLAIHAATAGEKTIRLPQTCRCTELYGDGVYETDTLLVACRQYETKLFRLEA